MARKVDPADMSYRVGATVSMRIRLFDAAFETSGLLPTKGPPDREPDVTLTEEGVAKTPSWRRIWTIGAPSGLASIGQGGSVIKTGAAISTTAEDPTSGFEPPTVADAVLASVDDPPPTIEPLISGTEQDPEVVLTRLIPRKVRLRLNGHRAADECHIELHLRQFPFAPDGALIRSILIELRRGVIDPDDWARAISEGAVAPDGLPLTVPIITASDEPDFAGFADVHEMRMPSDGSSVVVLPCRAFDGVLADTPMQGREIRTDVGMDEAIARLIGTIPAMVGMAVVWLGPEVPPVLGSFAPKTQQTKAGKGRPRQQKSSKESVLDAITDYCIMGAVIPRVRGYTLELGSVRTLDQYDATTVPRMVLGSNILDLEMKHRLTKAHARSVEVRSFNADTGKIMCARYPQDQARTGQLEPGQADALPPTGPLQVPPGADAVDEAAPEVMDVQNVTDPKQLQNIAQSVFEEMARQDLAMSMTTRDVATVDGRAIGDPDLLALRAGDPLQMIIAPAVEDAVGSYIQRLASLPRADAIKELVDGGWKGEVAIKVLDGIIFAKKPFIYRTKDVDWRWEFGGGTETQIGLVNFIEVLDAELKAGKQPKGNFAAIKDSPNATPVQKWNAVEADMLAGEISPEDAVALQQAIGEAAQREKRTNEAWQSLLDAESAATDEAPPIRETF